MKASWGNTSCEVASLADLDRVLVTVQSSATPTMLFLEASNGTTLAIGVDAPEAVLVFVDAQVLTRSVDDAFGGSIERAK